MNLDLLKWVFVSFTGLVFFLLCVKAIIDLLKEGRRQDERLARMWKRFNEKGGSNE